MDEDKCTGCSECTQACPVDIPDEFNRCLGTRKGIAKLYAQATPNIFGILKHGHAPCKVKCPARVNVQGYVQLIKKKEYLKAVNLVRQRNPLSAICGRICTHPCESVCTRGKADDPIAIRLLKRFASDQEIEMLAAGKLALPEEKSPAPDAKKVAVIGGGPAGLTAAADLADAGFAVTVFEALSAAGGMLRWGIPEYRLPKDILDHEVELIRRKGVKFVYNCRIGQNITFQSLRQDYQAIFLSAGAQKSRKLRIEGEQINGVLHGVEFLRDAASARKPAVKDRVLVIGGGNVAVDVARTALRLGARKVEMVCLERRDEMPAYKEEIEATLAENITHPRWLGTQAHHGEWFRDRPRAQTVHSGSSTIRNGSVPPLTKTTWPLWKPTRSLWPSARWWTSSWSGISRLKANEAASRPTRSPGKPPSPAFSPAVTMPRVRRR